MRKYKVLVRGENFLINVDGKDQRLGFYTTAFVEARNEEEAEDKAIALLRDDEDLRRGMLNKKSDSPMMFAEEIAELDSFEGVHLPRTGFSYFPEEEQIAEDA
jgi:hypothetical protein